MNIWRVLGLEPTRDLSAIRRAYAAAAKRYHPEEQPEKFQQLRAAYEQALSYARSAAREVGPGGEGDGNGSAPAPSWEKYRDMENKSIPKKGVATGGTYLEGPRRSGRPLRSGLTGQRSVGPAVRVEPLSGGGAGPEPDWLREETAEGQADLFRSSPAMDDFRQLWRQEKKRGDKQAWREYFSSPAFLAAQREEGFTAALLEFLEGEVKGGQTLPQRFLLELVIVYGIRFSGRTPVYLSCAAFPGIDHIRAILSLGDPPDRLSHEEDKVWAACWRDYFELLSLAKNGGFEDPDRTRRWKELFDRYRREKVTARPEVTRKREEEVEYRHPYGLRLLAALVNNHSLPAEAIQYLYDSLQLERLASGSARRDYKPLLDAVLPILPDQDPVREEKEALLAVKNAVEDLLRRYNRRVPFPHTDVLRSYDVDDSPGAKKAARAVVEMPQFQRLLLTRRLEEDGVLDRIFSAPTALIEVLVRQVGDRTEYPSGAAIAARAMAANRRWARDPIYFFDRPHSLDGVGPDSIDPGDREFWDYYFSTAFPAAFSTDREDHISSIIGEASPASLWWRRAFTGFNETLQRIVTPRSRVLLLGERQVTVEFHLHYQRFLVDGVETVEKFPWEEFLALAGEDPLLFWLCLPLAMGRDEDRPAIRRELMERVAEVFIYAPTAWKLMDCLVNHVVASRGQLASWVYREDGRSLYGYEIRKDRTLEVFRPTGILRRREKLWDRPFPSIEVARVAAEQYIDTLLTPLLRRLERRPVAGAIPQHKARALADCLGEGKYTWEDEERDRKNKPALATDDFLDYGAKHHGSYTADFYRKYLRHPYRAGVRFGSQEGERFLLEFALEVWPYGSDKAKRERRGELLTQLGMLGEAAYFIGAIRVGKTRYTLISNSQRRLLFAVREGTSNYHSGRDLPTLLAGMLIWDEWEAVEFVERYENTSQ